MVNETIERHDNTTSAMLAEDQRLLNSLNGVIAKSQGVEHSDLITGIQVHRRNSSFSANGASMTITHKRVAIGTVDGANHVPKLAADYLSAIGIKPVDQKSMKKKHVSQIGKMPELDDKGDAPALVIAA